MNSRSKPIVQRLLKLLQDETRLTIYIHLIIFEIMTLKQLSIYLGKGKTTIHHHIKKFEEERILKWVEEKEDRKKLKTRFYSFSDALKDELSNDDLRIEKMELNVLLTNSLTKLMFEYFKKRSDIMIDKLKPPPIITIPLSEEGVLLYEDFLKKLSQLNSGDNLDQLEKDRAPLITYFGSYSFVPIREILKWKLKQNIAED